MAKGKASVMEKYNTEPWGKLDGGTAPRKCSLHSAKFSAGVQILSQRYAGFPRGFAYSSSGTFTSWFWPYHQAMNSTCSVCRSGGRQVLGFWRGRCDPKEMTLTLSWGGGAGSSLQGARMHLYALGLLSPSTVPPPFILLLPFPQRVQKHFRKAW